jgi:hypothetical protein
MALARGTRLSPYEIVALLGHGGMGEVSRDLNDVAGDLLKPLRDGIAVDGAQGDNFQNQQRR